MPRIAMLVLVTLAFLVPGSLSAQDCRTITEATARLKCFDDGANTGSPSKRAASENGDKTAPIAFMKYPTEVYRGPIVFPDFNGRDRKHSSLRTRIRNGMKSGPNFAGHLTLVEVGCGAGCRTVPVADVKTGRVYDFPLGGEDNMYLNLKFKPDSRLVVAFWESDERCIREDLVWNEQQFQKLARTDLGVSQICRETDASGFTPADLFKP
jgi:hypothetical protein